MDEFADVANARAAYKVFEDAMQKGREVMMRAGVANAPPIPDFDQVYRRLTAPMRRDLFSAVKNAQSLTAAEAIRIWQPFIRRAFGQPKV